jgi:hypothetical protein
LVEPAGRRVQRKVDLTRQSDQRAAELLSTQGQRERVYDLTTHASHSWDEPPVSVSPEREVQ